MRATNRGAITFGLVTVPIKIYSSIKSTKASFSMLSPSGNKTKQKLIDSVTLEEVDRSDTIKGYQYQSGKYVTFSEAELASLGGLLKSAHTLDIISFVGADFVSREMIEKTYYVGVDNNGEKSFSLLAQAMEKQNVIGIAKWTTGGREYLVAIRPVACDGAHIFMMERLYYESEVKSYNEIIVHDHEFSDEELGLASLLIDNLRQSDFSLASFKDNFSASIAEAAIAKAAGAKLEITSPIATEHVSGSLIDALRASITNPIIEKAS